MTTGDTNSYPKTKTRTVTIDSNEEVLNGITIEASITIAENETAEWNAKGEVELQPVHGNGIPLRIMIDEDGVGPDAQVIIQYGSENQQYKTTVGNSILFTWTIKELSDDGGTGDGGGTGSSDITINGIESKTDIGNYSLLSSGVAYLRYLYLDNFSISASDERYKNSI
jgi:hypothetical protein